MISQYKVKPRPIDESAGEQFFKRIFESRLHGMPVPDGVVEAQALKYPPLGELVAFRYDPKHKETLPVYDTLPLVLILSVKRTHFYGINLHYIKPSIRKKIMERLLSAKLATGDNQLLYIQKIAPVLNMLSQHTPFAPYFRNYLPEQLKSKIAVIGTDHWKAVSEMPLQNFKKVKENTVWSTR